MSRGSLRMKTYELQRPSSPPGLAANHTDGTPGSAEGHSLPSAPTRSAPFSRPLGAQVLTATPALCHRPTQVTCLADPAHDFQMVNVLFPSARDFCVAARQLTNAAAGSPGLSIAPLGPWPSDLQQQLFSTDVPPQALTEALSASLNSPCRELNR